MHKNIEEVLMEDKIDNMMTELHKEWGRVIVRSFSFENWECPDDIDKEELSRIEWSISGQKSTNEYKGETFTEVLKKAYDKEVVKK